MKIPGWLDGLRATVGGGEDELGRDDLARLVPERILALSAFGARGARVFPPAVLVRVVVGTGSVEVVRDLVEDASFEREVEDRILNALAHPERERLPLRRYVVEKGERNEITVQADAGASVARVRVEGGDRDGATFALAAGQKEFRLGRGRWHGPDGRVPNDVVVSQEDKFVSRAAALLRRAGSFLELEARDQAECLVVVREDGARIRPSRTGTGRVLVRPGDALEFNDGAEAVVRLRLEAGGEP